jgi:hypothetical protein
VAIIGAQTRPGLATAPINSNWLMILCADDYGLSDDINQAILELARGGKLSAVSCMVALERCDAGSLAELLACQARVDIGLHLCLTDESLPLSRWPDGRAGPPPLPSFGTVVRRALLGLTQPQEIARQTSAQYGLFVEKCGRKPDFIDGHLHLHQLPGIREGLIQFVRTLPADGRPYIRNTHMPWREVRGRQLPWMKHALIGVFGARMFRQLRLAGIPTNEGFAGIYNFRDSSSFRVYLPRFAASLSNPNGILVAHPGHSDHWRAQEFAALRGFNPPPGALNRFQH